VENKDCDKTLAKESIKRAKKTNANDLIGSVESPALALAA